MFEVVEWEETIQGEFPNMGEPCVLIRFKRCNLACSYCDAEAMSHDPVMMTVEDIMTKLKESGIRQVLLTGGEPLFHDSLEVNALLHKLAYDQYKVVIETNGTLSLMDLDPPGGFLMPHKIAMDVKLFAGQELLEVTQTNMKLLRAHDILKCVVGDAWEMEAYLAFLEEHITYPMNYTVVFSPRDGYKLPIQHLIRLGKKYPLLHWKAQAQLHKVWEVA